MAGTVGLPGRRTFFLQASSGPRVTSVSLEKTQVAALAERMDELLDEVVRRTGGNAPVPAVAPAEAADTAPLDVPVEEEFRVGTMALAWDGEEQRMIVEAQALVELDADSDEDLAEAEERLLQDEENGPPMLRVRLTGAQARAFAKRALDVVNAGRPPCLLCSLPWTRRGTCARARTATGARRDGHGGTGGTARQGRAHRHRPDPGGVQRRPAVQRHVRGSERRLCVQAGQGRAAAVGLPRREPRPPGGRRVPDLRGHRMGPGPRHRAARRPVRRGHGPAVDRGGAAGRGLPARRSPRARRRRGGGEGWKAVALAEVGEGRTALLVHADDPGCAGSPCSTP